MLKFENVTGYSPVDYPLPNRSTKGSAGYDFCVPPGAPGKIIIHPGESAMFFTGVKFRCPENYYLRLVGRNSTGNKLSLRLKNGEGVIDSDYYNNPKNEGNIGICLYNFGDKLVTLEPGQKVIQGIIQKYYTVDDEVESGSRDGASFFAEKE